MLLISDAPILATVTYALVTSPMPCKMSKLVLHERIVVFTCEDGGNMLGIVIVAIGVDVLVIVVVPVVVG